MDVLILSCGTGGGHDSAGRAVLEEMEKRGHHVVMQNPYTLKSNRLSGGIDKTYISTVQNIPRVFGGIYKIGDLYRRLPFRSPVYFVNHAMNGVLQEYLEENHFDIVIMPHLFPAEILTNMKLHGMTIPKTMFIATDYVCIPFTEETECDAYVIPAADLADNFAGRGIPREKLHALGIPTHSSFAAHISREDAKRRLGLEADKKYILVAGGSMGGGGIEKTIAKLGRYFATKTDTELIVICGSNQALFEKLKEQSAPGMRVLEHTDDMAAYLKACNLYITKPGGLSSTEAAVCGVPIVHTSLIPGCESCNAQYFSGHGMSIFGEMTEELLHTAGGLLGDDLRSAEMIACQRKCINSNAAADICNLAEEMVAVDATHGY